MMWPPQAGGTLQDTDTSVIIRTARRNVPDEEHASQQTTSTVYLDDASQLVP